MSDRPNHFILLGGKADFGALDGSKILEPNEDGEIIWTVPKSAKTDDEVFIYITAPLSAIVARAKCAENSWLQEHPLSDWQGYYMAELADVEIFPEEKRIAMKTLRSLFPDWRWLSFPRQNVRVPQEFLQPFLELFDE
ncbi:MAG: hypothetical protein M3209_09615 [Acidobacteriota bacterium]|nr:hypothetical protein [Acidobacteriota bacterium]